MKRRVTMCCFLAACGATCATARGQVNSWDFEPPAFVTGPLNGQSGWGAPPNVTVTNTLAHSGAQSAHISPTGYVAGGHATGQNSPLGWSMSWSMYINSAATNPNSLCVLALGAFAGPGFYVGVYGDARIEIFGTPVVSDSLGASALDQWLDIAVVGYNPTGAVDVTVNGNGVNRAFHATLPVQYVRQDFLYLITGETQFGDVYIDDVSVNVPSPGGAALFGLGAMFALRRRR